MSAWGIGLCTTQATDDILLAMHNTNRLRTDQLRGTSAGNGLGLPVISKLKMSLQHASAQRRLKASWAALVTVLASRLKEVVIPLYSALIRSCLEYCIQFWYP